MITAAIPVVTVKSGGGSQRSATGRRRKTRRREVEAHLAGIV